jgi:cephalosporin hydroxylase
MRRSLICAVVAGLTVAAWLLSPGLPLTLAQSRSQDRAVIDAYHRYFYGAGPKTWDNSFWPGVQVWKMPLDMWIYQELIHEVKPDLIIECGTWKSGSAYNFASIMDRLKRGRVITLDIGRETTGTS